MTERKLFTATPEADENGLFAGMAITQEHLSLPELEAVAFLARRVCNAWSSGEDLATTSFEMDIHRLGTILEEDER
tara:strand:- start:224 stop:451 length:228 start_codon:yes stop_codon:yes gene_type:complete